MLQEPDCHISDIKAPNMTVRAIVALGANLPSRVGSPEITIKIALEAIGDSPLKLVNVSKLYATPCFPAGAGPDYVNAAAVVTGLSDPGEILTVLHQIEADFGRKRLERWGQRVLDLDLIAVDSQVLPSESLYATWRNKSPDEQKVETPDQLILPHPRMQDRAFVLVPMAEIVPDWRHPVLGQTVMQMLDAVPMADKIAVTPLKLGEI